MKKAWVIAAVVAAGALLARALGSGAGKMDIGERIAAMPDTSPPKWIYTNVTAIRANTERILALLDEQRPTSTGTPPPPPEPEAAREVGQRAGVVEHLLPDVDAVMLFTDASNPTSNAIYERLGFRHVADVVDLDLEPV